MSTYNGVLVADKGDFYVITKNGTLLKTLDDDFYQLLDMYTSSDEMNIAIDFIIESTDLDNYARPRKEEINDANA